MSFLKNLFEKEARKIISSTVDNVVDSAMDALGVNGRTASDTVNTAQGQHKAASNEYGGEAGVRERIKRIISEEYPGFEIREQIPAYQMGAVSGARDYSIGLYQNGLPKAMLMLISNSNHWQRSDVVKARNACLQSNVAYMNFMTYFPNREDYIRERLRTHITL